MFKCKRQRAAIASGLCLLVAVVLLRSQVLAQRSMDVGTDQNSAARSFTSQAAVAARGTCNRAIGEAGDDYRLRVLKAKRTYREALLAARQSAMKTASLDEANSLDAEIKNVDGELQSAGSTDLPSVSTALVITKAQYGIEGHWLDITKLLNSQIHQGRIQSVVDLTDPASGVAKTAIINGTLGGKKFTLQFPEQFPLNHLIFGAPLNAGRN